MTVKDLIAFLQTCPQDADVYTFDGDNGGWDIIPEGTPEYHEKIDINTWGRKPIYAYNAVLL